MSKQLGAQVGLEIFTHNHSPFLATTAQLQFGRKFTTMIVFDNFYDTLSCCVNVCQFVELFRLPRSASNVPAGLKLYHPYISAHVVGKHEKNKINPLLCEGS